MKGALAVVAGLALAVGFAFQLRFADSALFWWLLAGPLWALGAASALALGRRGRLGPLLGVRPGDVMWGVMAALLLLGATWLGRTQLSPLGTPRQLWLFRIYMQLGDPKRLENSLALTLLVSSLAVAQELVLRGYVQEVFEARFGPRGGFTASALSQGFVFLPTLWLLSAPVVGLNPLLFLVALLVGATLGLLRRVTSRLPPVMVAQLVFTYFSVQQFRLPGL